MSFEYHNELKWSGEHKGILSTGKDKPDISVATPPEFGGHTGLISPEDLFVGSMNVCFMTTFLAFAKKANITPLSYESIAIGYLEKVDGKNVFTRIVVKPKIRADADSDMLLAVVERVKDYSIVLNSMKTVVEVDVKINV
ncbi:MAG TPA: OsmC family peroxiredoxin [Methanosarcinaceae archaeon]|nr:OsmC family peroxiredoxin [Methanosarcinaceae archaeon]